ncbi:MAG: hypothetical protein LQ352_008157 [Teloschistes flavicans]|nr:MAG: hypothetical protein LQ352_008157 [Teloschistes flavicans]
MVQKKPQNRRSVIQVFDDVLSPPLKQATFPYRRHHSARRRTNASETTPAINWKQQTLTQITSYLSRSSSSHEEPTDPSELEYDTLPIAMPPRKCQKRSDKRILDQQTITQMDPFRPQIHPEEDLEEILNEYTEDAPKARGRKRRKTASGTPIARTIQTRSAKKQAEVDDEPAVKDPTAIQESDKENLHRGPTPALLDHGTVQMPPPKTPKTVRRKEIPSSQSPAETPYSVRIHTKRRALAASPLKERSTNAPFCRSPSSPTKAAKRTSKLEVADSTGLEDENIVSVHLLSQYELRESASALSLSPRPEDVPRSSMPCTPSNRNRHFDGNATKSLCSGPGGRGPPILRRQGTIADSEDEDISPIRRSPERPSNPQAEGPLPQHESILELGSVERSTSSAVTNSNSTQPTQLPPSTAPEDPSFETVPTQLLSQRSQQPILKPPTPMRTHSNTSLQEQSQRQPPEHEEALFQPTRKHRHPNPRALPPQPPPLETESQFENAWREYTPPPSPLLDDNYADSQPIDLGPTQPIHPPQQPVSQSPKRLYSMTDNPISQPPPKPFRPSNDSMTRLPPVPPSQATTTDEVTQSSPRHPSSPKRRPRHLQQSSTTTSLHTEQLPSSPPAQQIPLSSSSPPLLSRSEEEEEAVMEMGIAGHGDDEYEGWNGVRMTDSQLLPASLLDEAGLEVTGLEADEELLREEEEEEEVVGGVLGRTFLSRC